MCQKRNNTEIIWAKIVAPLAPAIPNFKTKIAKYSKAIFKIEAAIKAYNGVLESPKALRALDR